jgi:hypothetical protein
VRSIKLAVRYHGSLEAMFLKAARNSFTYLSRTDHQHSSRS